MYKYIVILITSVLTACSSPDTLSIHIAEPVFTVRRNLESLVPAFDGILIDPAQCEFDNDGNLYVLDVRTDQILVINDNLQVVDVYAGSGSGPGEFQPGSKLMAVGEDRIVVLRWPTIHLFDLEWSLSHALHYR